MTPWVRIGVVVVAFVLVLSLLQFVLAIHPPRTRSTVTPADHGLAYEDVRFETEDGVMLAGWFIPAANATNRTILVGHGYPFDKGNVLAGSLFLTAQYNVFLFDHRSFGESDGRITTLGLREVYDVRAAVDVLASRDDSEHIGALGFSLSAATILMANEERIGAIVADSSFSSLDRMTHQAYRLFPGPLKLPFVWTTHALARLFLGAWPSDVSPADAIAGTSAPVLLIHGTADGTIPPDHAQRLLESAPEGIVELWTVEGAEHGAAHAVAGAAYERRVLEHLGKHMG